MRVLMKFTLSWSFILLLSAVAPADVTLVKDGQAKAVVVIALDIQCVGTLHYRSNAVPAPAHGFTFLPA